MNEEDIKDVDLDTKQVYEVGFHIVPTVDEGSVEKEVDIIKDLVVKHGGSIVSESFPTLINLAYSISKTIGTDNKDFDKAYFGSIKFEVARGEIEAIGKAIQVNPSILRSLVVKTVKENTLYYAKEQHANKDRVDDVDLTSDQTEMVDEEVVKTNEVEIDKSIDELIA